MKIAIISDVHVGRPLLHEGKIRSFSDSVMPIFSPFLDDLIARQKPDVLINMGDLIRSESPDVDIERYRTLIKQYKSLPLHVIHLLGNHEIKRLPQNDVETTWKEHGFDQASFGIKSFDELDIIWLGIEKESEQSNQFILPLEQLSWLENTLVSCIKPVLIFIHCAIDDQDVSGNFFYEALDGQKKDLLFLKNQSQIQKILHSKRTILAVFQGHLHYFHAQIRDEIPYITCPAMNDNICGPDVLHNHPQIYTIATIHQNHFSVKAYSKEYCFAGFERR